MITSLPYVRPALASKRSWTLLRCKWCGKPQFEAKATGEVRFRCNDRGCHMEQTARID